MDNILEKLSWLLQPPDDFNDILNSVNSIEKLIETSKYSLNDIQMNNVAKKLKDFQDFDSSSLIPIKLGIVSNSTTDFLTSGIISTGLRYGFHIDIIQTDFNQVAQVAFDDNSIIKTADVDAILLSIDHNGLPFPTDPGIKEDDEAIAKKCFEYITNIVSSLQTKTSQKIIVQNIVTPMENIYGSYERRLSGTKKSIISKINLMLDELNKTNVYILDINSLASNVGIFNWYDPKYWNVAKVAFSMKYIPIFSEYVCRILSSSLGRSRRVLVLDLDNTCWGGVIGDDGIDGILIGHGDPTAEAHLAIQKLALELRARGIVLAVSSKNEENIALEPFKSHPDMVLKEDHIAVFHANWKDKASNIRQISEKLSLGLDSFVFLDDNPAERMQVRSELPQVAVPELPDDPAVYPSILVSAGYFEAVGFSDEDSKRADFYSANLKREAISSNASNMEEYLQSLNMEVIFNNFDEIGRPRIFQLISKSNQFNLTTKRYTENEITKFQNDDNFFTRQIRLTDCFGDNGMISVLICKKDKNDWLIDTWLMSCRVLERKVEYAVLDHIVKSAKNSNIKKLKGLYIPTERNVIVKDHYKKLGFSLCDKTDIQEIWELSLSEYEPIDLPMRVVDAF